MTSPGADEAARTGRLPARPSRPPVAGKPRPADRRAATHARPAARGGGAGLRHERRPGTPGWSRAATSRPRRIALSAWRAPCSSRRPSAPISSSWPAGAIPACRAERRRRHGRAACIGPRHRCDRRSRLLLEFAVERARLEQAGGGAVRRLARQRQRPQSAALRFPQPGRAQGNPRLAGAGAPRAGRVPRRFQPPSRGRSASGAGRGSARRKPLFASAGPSMP